MAILDAIKHGQWFNVPVAPPKLISVPTPALTKRSSSGGSTGGRSRSDIELGPGTDFHNAMYNGLRKEKRKIESAMAATKKRAIDGEADWEESQRQYGALNEMLIDAE